MSVQDNQYSIYTNDYFSPKTSISVVITINSSLLYVCPSKVLLIRQYGFRVIYFGLWTIVVQCVISFSISIHYK